MPNGGNWEYLQDEYNCLLYPAGDLEKAKCRLERICTDKELQNLISKWAKDCGRDTLGSGFKGYFEFIFIDKMEVAQCQLIYRIL